MCVFHNKKKQTLKIFKSYYFLHFGLLLHVMRTKIQMISNGIKMRCDDIPMIWYEFQSCFLTQYMFIFK